MHFLFSIKTIDLGRQNCQPADENTSPKAKFRTKDMLKFSQEIMP